MKKKQNKFLWFVFVVILPIIFTISLAVMIFWLMGVDIVGKTKEYAAMVPVVSTLGEDETEISEQSKTNKIETLTVKFKKQKTEITHLKEEIEQKETTIRQQQEDISVLKEQLQALSAQKEQEKNTYKEIADVYQSITPKSAAEILSNLEESEAVEILSKLPTEIKAQILSEMDPEKAAIMTQLMVSTAS